MRLLFRPLLALMGMTLLLGCSGRALAPAADPGAAAPLVTLALGRVQGSAGEVAAFKGMPYARPPVGRLRWREPQPPLAWDGVRDASHFGAVCVQAGRQDISEDCLFINVWTPRRALEPGRKLPVLVWVYGGSFHQGSGNIDGAELARKGAVVVSMNYRVSTLGFMAHPQLSAESPEGVSGNYGIRDIAQALRWVQAHIQAFGGDPSRVTLWGQSSGASAITALMVSPQARGLFQQVILQSPGAFRHWLTLAQAERQGLAVGPDLAQLRALPVSQLPVIQNTGGGQAVRALSQPRVIGPVKDGRFLPDEERPVFEAGRMVPAAVLVGSNSDEGLMFTGNYPMSTVEQYRRYLSLPEVFGRFGEEAFSLYPVADASQVRRAIAMSFGDSQFWYGTRGVARAAAQAGLPAYRYFFSRRTQGGQGADPLHGGEIPYVMGDARLRSAPFNADDLQLSASMMAAWLNFATHGDPNGPGVPRWPRYDARSETVLVFDAPASLVQGPRNRELDFIGRFDAAQSP